jgi:hypothetical protein
MSSCLLCSGGCTLSAHGFFLQSGLLPQMFISVPHEGKLLHAVSRLRVSDGMLWITMLYVLRGEFITM